MTEFAHAWRIIRVSALYEILQPGRLVGATAQLAMQLFLTWCLWTALFTTVSVSAGLDRGQAVTYAVLGALYGRLRGPDREAAEDSVRVHVREGSIQYWYLRPLDPSRYHWLRAVGDQAYGLTWAAVAFLACLSLGLIEPPASGAAAGVFVVTLAFGQVILYYLLAIVDVACFWMLNNMGMTFTIRFAQSLFAGAIAPLWFFPDWFRTLSACLPFESSLHVPLSVYVGRIDPASSVRYIAVQILWVLVLGLVLRRFWRRADHQVVIQGG
jgi:ABC-2 type transport system permease protein